MDRIKLIRIVPTNHGPVYVSFCDELDLKYDFPGKRYAPQKSYQILRRIIRESGMVCDIDLFSGIITVRPKACRTQDENEKTKSRAALIISAARSALLLLDGDHVDSAYAVLDSALSRSEAQP